MRDSPLRRSIARATLVTQRSLVCMLCLLGPGVRASRFQGSNSRRSPRRPPGELN